MQPFADSSSVEAILVSFTQNSILKADGARIWLTDNGAEINSNCLSQQHLFRQPLYEGHFENEYQTTLLTLKKLVTNLEE